MSEENVFTAWEFSDQSIENDQENKPIEQQPRRRRVELFERETKTVYRRAYSETKLLDCLGMEPFKEGYSYHFITAGDVDSLSYLKLILRHQSPLEYCLASTWCMNSDDILQFDQWLTDKIIKRLDFYVGEIFPGSYKIEYKMLRDMFEKHQCGRIAVFRNHAKIFAGYGNEFYFTVESSANIQTNPRTENGCITIDRGLYQFYRDYFDGIVSFDKKDHSSKDKISAPPPKDLKAEKLKKMAQ